jgi:hypothetical protein
LRQGVVTQPLTNLLATSLGKAGAHSPKVTVTACSSLEVSCWLIPGPADFSDKATSGVAIMQRFAMIKSFQHLAPIKLAQFFRLTACPKNLGQPEVRHRMPNKLVSAYEACHSSLVTTITSHFLAHQLDVFQLRIKYLPSTTNGVPTSLCAGVNTAMYLSNYIVGIVAG